MLTPASPGLLLETQAGAFDRVTVGTSLWLQMEDDEHERWYTVESIDSTAEEAGGRASKRYSGTPRNK